MTRPGIESRSPGQLANTQTIMPIYIYIIMLCHQHGYPWPSLATSSYRSLPLAGLQGYIPYSHWAAVCMHIRAGRHAFARLYVGVHRSTSLMSSSLFLKHCPACLVRLTLIVFVMGGTIYPTPPLRQDMTQGQFLSGV